jgi:opacity protein-like surface antigen
MLKHTTALAAVASLFAAPALAGNITPATPEPVIAAPAPVPVAPLTPNWTGFYAGGQLGYAWVDTDINNVDGDDIIGGIVGGYDYDLGNWVVGAGLDYDFADIGLSGVNASVEEVFRAKLRGGYKIGRGLLYGTGGYAWTQRPCRPARRSGSEPSGTTTLVAGGLRAARSAQSIPSRALSAPSVARPVSSSAAERAR